MGLFSSKGEMLTMFTTQALHPFKVPVPFQTVHIQLFSVVVSSDYPPSFNIFHGGAGGSSPNFFSMHTLIEQSQYSEQCVAQDFYVLYQ